MCRGRRRRRRASASRRPRATRRPLVFKTYHQAAYRQALAGARVGRVAAGRRARSAATRVAGIYRLKGHELGKLASGRHRRGGRARPHGRGRDRPGADGLRQARRRRRMAGSACRRCSRWRINVENRADEVKLTAALHKLVEEDPSLSVEHNPDTHELVLVGPGRDPSADRRSTACKLKYGLAGQVAPPDHQLQGDHPPRHQAACALQAAERRPRPVRRCACRDQAAAARHRLRIRRQDRRRRRAAQLHPVGRGGRRATISSRGPLGFPVVDVAVTLYDGQYHAVDSSDMAFKTAARMAMSEGMPKCEPVLLEPICAVQITVPNDFTARVHGLHQRPARPDPGLRRQGGLAGLGRGATPTCRSPSCTT